MATSDMENKDLSFFEKIKENQEKKKQEKLLDLQYGVKEKKGPGQYVLAVLLCIYMFIVALPIILVFVSAFTDEDALIKNGYSYFYCSYFRFHKMFCSILFFYLFIND